MLKILLLVALASASARQHLSLTRENDPRRSSVNFVQKQSENVKPIAPNFSKELAYLKSEFLQPESRTQISGRDFVFAIPNSHIWSDNDYTEALTLTIFNVGSRIAADVEITSSYVNFTTIKLRVPAGKSVLVPILPADIQVDYQDPVEFLNKTFFESKALFISSTQLISATVTNTQTDGYSGETYELIPVSQLGTSYRYTSFNSVAEAQSYGSTLAIIAVHDNTSVYIDTYGEFLVDRGRVLVVREEVYVVNHRILANKAIAVIGGNLCGFSWTHPSICDHSIVQLQPTDTWGTEFPVSQIKPRLDLELWVVANEDGTEVYRNGIYSGYNLSRTESIAFTDSETSFLISTSKPAVLLQIGNFVDSQEQLGSPFLIHVTPPNHFTNRPVHFVTEHYPETHNPAHSVKITTTSNFINGLLLDNNPIPSSTFTQIGTSQYYKADIDIDAGDHVVSARNRQARFSVTAYGESQFNAYAFTPGLELSVRAEYSGNQ